MPYFYSCSHNLYAIADPKFLGHNLEFYTHVNTNNVNRVDRSSYQIVQLALGACFLKFKVKSGWSLDAWVTFIRRFILAKDIKFIL